MNPGMDPAFSGIAKRPMQYMERFHEILSSRDGQFDIDEVIAGFQIGAQTVKKYLRQYMDLRPSQINRVIGFYPSADTVIRLAETELGKIDGNNLYAINLHCKNTIDAITKPKHKRFLEVLLKSHIDPQTGVISIVADQLTEMLYDQYVDFVHESDNGLVSIAGGMNEKILMRGLENAGLVVGTDLRRTGTDSEGDIQIEHRSRTTRIMYCEVKSYAARERLLRGLQDIPHPDKVGVGFFNDASEFNPDRTQTLLQAGPMAIYMPDITYQALVPNSVSQTTLTQDKLYRPLSRFIEDMLHYRDRGTLPSFR